MSAAVTRKSVALVGGEWRLVKGAVALNVVARSLLLDFPVCV